MKNWLAVSTNRLSAGYSSIASHSGPHSSFLMRWYSRQSCLASFCKVRMERCQPPGSCTSVTFTMYRLFWYMRVDLLPTPRSSWALSSTAGSLIFIRRARGLDSSSVTSSNAVHSGRSSSTRRTSSRTGPLVRISCSSSA